MFGTPYRLFSVRGIDISADVSWLLIVGLVSWSFWGRFVVWYDRPGGVALVMAAAAALALFSSVVVHELAHALEARRRGVTVEGITLFVFGGVTHSRFDVKRPVDELALTAVGPASSLLLAGAFGLVVAAANGLAVAPVAEVAGNLAWLNLALAVFNLLPGAPLDGGRILRAVVWHRTGDRQRAIATAATAGRLLGGLIIGLGVVQFLTGSGFGGLWLALIGWFLHRAATAELAHGQLATLLAQRTAGELATWLEPVPASTSVTEAIDRWFVPTEHDTFPVAAESTGGDTDGTWRGVIDLAAVSAVSAERRATTTVDEVRRPVEDLPSVAADSAAIEAVDTVVETRGAVLVLDGEKPVGLLTPERLHQRLRRLQSFDELQRTAPGPPGRS